MTHSDQQSANPTPWSLLTGETETEEFVLCRDGMRALLNFVDAQDPEATLAKRTAAEDPVAGMKQYLSSTFLGDYFRCLRERPVYVHHVANLATALRWLQQQGLHPLHEVYLKLFAYGNLIEVPDPLVLMRNLAERLKDPRFHFDSKILAGTHSTRQKFNAVQTALVGQRSLPDESVRMLDFLDELLDKDLRNAIAHSTYRITLNSQIVTYRQDSQVRTLTFNEVATRFLSACGYLDGFKAAVSDFSRSVIPECSYPFDWGPRY